MRKRPSIVLLLGVAAILAPNAQSQNPPGKRIAVSIDAGKTSSPISPYIYGQFIEHIGPLINRSVWAEMLDDRKFYEEINSKPPIPTAGRGGRGPGRGRLANK